jgi:hypothetical protein
MAVIMKTVYHLFYAVVFISFLIVASGCYKLSEEYRITKKMDPVKLISRSWVKTEEIHSPANVIPNIFVAGTICTKDNQYKFDKDGYYEYNQGGSLCYSTQQFIIDQGNWIFQNGSGQLKVTYANGTKTRLYNVLQLDTNYNFVTTYIDSSTGTKVMVRESFDPR